MRKSLKYQNMRLIEGCWAKLRLHQYRKAQMVPSVLSLLRSGVKVARLAREARRWAGMSPRQMGQKP